ncbi:hypothetical protein VPH35_110323 [Triticum aestivum]
MLLIAMPRGRGRGRGPRGRSRGGRNNQEEEPHAESEHSHHGEELARESANSGGHNDPGMILKDWIGLKVDCFDGTGTPMDAASWLNTMEKYMDAMELTSQKRAQFVRFNLKNLADDWWTGVRAAHIPIYGQPTWEFFVQQFTAKYYPDSFKEEMSVKLNYLKQGKLTVDEYEAEFSKMVLFVDRVKCNEAEKAKAFFRGLNSKYREVMGANPPTDYLTMVRQARGMELEVRLTEAQENRAGGSGGTGGDSKVSYRGGSGSTPRPPFTKSKGNYRPQQTTKFKQSRSQYSSVPRSSSSAPSFRPVPGQGMICFKCGEGHCASVLLSVPGLGNATIAIVRVIRDWYVVKTPPALSSGSRRLLALLLHHLGDLCMC